MSDTSGSSAVARVIAGQMRLAGQYHRDAEILSVHVSRNAANLLFLAIEAALIAVLTSEGLSGGRSDQHQLGVMAGKLPDLNPLKPDFLALQYFAAYATTFRYVTPAGRIPAGPTAADLAASLGRAGALIEACRAWFGVEIDATGPARNSSPPRAP